MKKLSIKMKITIWYTGLMILIMGFVFAFIWLFAGQAVTYQAEKQLKEAAIDGVEEIRFQNGHYKRDDDFEFYDDGVSILIYDNAGTLREGSLPSGFTDQEIGLAHDRIQTVVSQQTEWMVYDYELMQDGQSVWIRAVMSIDSFSKTMNIIFLIVLISIPILILLAGFGGYWITKKAFKPLEEMNRAVNEIKEGKDLSQRIHLSGAKDEIHGLADTFNGMFERLETSFENEKQFTADASHELRTPTSVIISQAEYALTQLDHPAEVKEALQSILRQSTKMSELINQLLQLARTDQKNASIQYELFDMSELTEIVAEEMRELADENGSSVEIDIQPELKIEADQTLLMRLLMNLMMNGISYNKENGYVKIKLYEDGNDIVGEVSDNGIGIAEREQEKIWDRFYRIDSARTSRENGNAGLGLSMAKWIVEKHHGTITVKSQIGKGSMFQFRLPKRRG
ncbi:histidine kinase [Bacillus sp. FJAT-27916]|uniref:sensor histidine kinase n=1 Tax=Bacillaceae TaxID=186817 RepID=UPI0006712DEB|nr:HAMP domain-containing sensor histidine kinase [Bacillus sp. FJAT-27916]KMY43471.1 histidine kinase [Bacillus sp. FJAT-27916]